MTDNAPPARDLTLPPDDSALVLARNLIAGARHAALAVTDPMTGTPAISRIAFGVDADGIPLTLISALAGHSAALRRHPDCAVMVGEPGTRGDPLAAPRLMIQARAAFVDAGDPDRAALRDLWLKDHPKARLYVDFADFAFVRLHPANAVLNGGFARAFRLSASDLRA